MEEKIKGEIKGEQKVIENKDGSTEFQLPEDAISEVVY